jgi:hypothetical protein
LCPCFLCLFLSLVLSLDAAEQSSIFTDEAAAADIKVSQADPAKIIIDVKITAFQREIVQVDQKEYSRISLSNSTTTSAVGKPELPVIRELLAVPDGARFEANIVKSSFVTVDDFQAYPFQPPLKDGQQPGEFVIDETFMGQNDFYPYSLAQVDDPGVWRDLSVAGLNINPAAYNPVTKQLKLYTQINIRIDIIGGEQKTKTVNKKNAQMYKSLIKNYGSLDIVEEYETFDERYDQQLKDRLDSSDLPDTELKAGTPYDSSRKILSIRHSSCSTYSTILPLLDWHRRKGLPYYSYPISGTYTAQQIKDIIVSQYNAHPELEYVLLVGDIDYIPWQ